MSDYKSVNLSHNMKTMVSDRNIQIKSLIATLNELRFEEKQVKVKINVANKKVQKTIGEKIYSQNKTIEKLVNMIKMEIEKNIVLEDQDIDEIIKPVSASVIPRYTKIELIRMKMVQLKKICINAKVKNYSDYKKSALIEWMMLQDKIMY